MNGKRITYEKVPTLKVGDIVYYTRSTGQTRYCKVTDINKFSTHYVINGHWKNSKAETVKAYNTASKHSTGTVSINLSNKGTEVFKLIETWKERMEE